MATIAGRSISYKAVSADFVDFCQTMLEVSGFTGPHGQTLVNLLDFDKASQRATGTDEAIIFNSMKGEIYERYAQLVRTIKSSVRQGVILTVVINDITYKLGEKTYPSNPGRSTLVFYPVTEAVDYAPAKVEEVSF